ncbi:MAG TPA: cytochrome c [Chroococcales cyanobacterium]
MRNDRVRLASMVFGVLLVAGIFNVTVNAGKVKAASDGKQLFSKNCAGCHANGKNTMNPKFPIIGSTKLSSKDSFKAFVTKPTPPMPSFAQLAGNDADLTALYDYCKTLK